MGKYRSHLSTLLLALLLAFIAHHILVAMNGDDLRRSVLADLYLLDGNPHWRVFQNRLLGPYLERMLMRAAPVPDFGRVLFDLAWFGAAFFRTGRLGRLLVARQAGVAAAMLTFAVSLTGLFAHDWFFAWDVVGPALFMAFALLVALDAKPAWFVALFAVAIWNRDDALFIALFLIVQPVIDWWRGRPDSPSPRRAWTQVAAGLACAVCGVLLIAALRRYWLVEETGPRLFGYTPDRTWFFHWALRSNLGYVVHRMPLGALGMPAFVVLPPIVITGACIWLARAGGGSYLAYALVNLAMVAATLMFGTIREPRIWVDLLPAVVLATTLALARADQAGSGQRSRYG